jgi:hypothetical protein
MALLVLAGSAFALAATLPEGLHYRPWRSILSGLVPLLMLAHFTLYVGPGDRFAYQHLRFLVPSQGLFFDDPVMGYSFAVLLGVAIAAGFVPRATTPQETGVQT